MSAKPAYCETCVFKLIAQGVPRADAIRRVQAEQSHASQSLVSK